MTDRDALLEARIARRITANWTKIKQSKVTPLEVAQDIVRALAETHALAAEPPALDAAIRADALREALDKLYDIAVENGDDSVSVHQLRPILDPQS